jgi:cytochrome c oxidase cbb3-type subunit I/II
VRFAVVALVVILIGGLVELIPTYVIKSNIPTIPSVRPYTPLELLGRDIYIREGCNTCHSQMVRPFRSETERYGEYSKAGEYVYDHPFLWGSKRTGPDLHREGRKYPNLWHYLHMNDPRAMSPGSIMPPYPWLLTQDLDTSVTARKIRAMQTLGVPYPAGYDSRANEDLEAQAETIAADLMKAGAPTEPGKDIIALIAYLQRLGTDIRPAQP